MRLRALWALPAFVLVGTVAYGPAARAAEVTDVASSFDTDNPFDFRFRLGYEYLDKTAAIKREHVGDPGQDKITVLKDLVYHQRRHTMSMRAEIGIFQDLAIHVELPFVIDDQRDITYDQRLGTGCIYQGTGANCVNAGNSTTTNFSGVVNENPADPNYYLLPPSGYNAQTSTAGNPAGFADGSPNVFRGPKRGGSGSDLFDTLNLGITWAALSQKRDDTKPTWTVGLEYRVSIGNVMAFDRDRPDANHGVSDGLDHIVARMAISHRFKYFDPYIQFFYDYPFVRRNDTLFYDLGAAAKNQAPQMSGGVVFGLEGVPWERVKEQYKFAIDVNGRIQGKFDGRGYSEAWEMFASSPALQCDPSLAWTVTWNPSCGPTRSDGTPNKNSYQGKPFSGVTNIENYASLGAEVGFNVQAGKYVRVRASYIYLHDQAHGLTMDDVGKPTMAGSRVVNPEEFNPAYRPIINEIGRRYRAEDIDTHSAKIWAQIMF